MPELIEYAIINKVGFDKCESKSDIQAFSNIFFFLFCLLAFVQTPLFELNPLTDLFFCSSQNHLIDTLFKVVLLYSEKFVSNVPCLLPQAEPISS